MDSDSDWDSLTAGISAVKTNKSVKAAASPSKMTNSKYQSPTGPNIKPTPPDQTSKRIDIKRGRDEHKDGFQAVELVDQSHKEKNNNKSNKKSKKANAPLEKETLPYTNFQVDTEKGKPKNVSIAKKTGGKQYEEETNENTNNDTDNDTNNSWDNDDYENTENIMQNNGKSLYKESLYDPQMKKQQVKVVNRENNSYKRTVKKSSVPFQNQHQEETRSNIELNNKQMVVSQHVKSPVNDSYITLEANNQQYVAHLPQDKTDNDSFKLVEKRFYYEELDHHYHRVTISNEALTPKYADKAEKYMQRCWQEIFGLLRILIDFVLIFLIELLKFISKSIVQKLLRGLTLCVGDLILKPLLSSIYNSLIQPVFVLLWNVFNGVRILLQPLLTVLNEALTPIANLLKAFRLFEYSNNNNNNNVGRLPVKEI